MNSIRTILKVIACELLLVAATGTARAEITDRHRALADSVFNRLLSVMERPAGWEVWPPKITVIDPGFLNAFAGYRVVDGVDIPYVEVTVDTIEQVAKFDADVLSYTLGHELGHLNFRHSYAREELHNKLGGKSLTIEFASRRENEHEADLFGMQLALRAGYSRQALIKDLSAWRETSAPYCRFEGLSVGHPTWEERAAFLLEDERQRAQWRSLSSFQTGVMFLENQQYTHARLCFKNVVAEFPECYEGWANLGYALLMQYCDAWDREDLERMDIGHLVIGGFYRRPASLEPTTRGVNDELWFEAVGAFREALRLRDRLRLEDELIMVKANLAVAYLVHPNGKDLGQAERLFEEVFATLRDPQKAKDIDPLVQASIFINFGSARNLEEDVIKETLNVLARVKNDRKSTFAVQSLEAALAFNRARAMIRVKAEDTSVAAIDLLATYLNAMTPASSWWPIAYQQYVDLCKASNKTPKRPDEFKTLQPTDWRPVTSVTLKNGVLIGLSESFEEVKNKLGEPTAVVPVIDGSNLKYYRYEELGVKILATREILAIILDSKESPTIPIKRPGLGGDASEISLGMAREKLESLVGGDWDYEITGLFGSGSLHQLYRKLGIAVLFDRGQVSEIIVAVVPISK
jgi:tetratricopeptide (TPR) repeat protein